jgi:hypothetical protein
MKTMTKTINIVVPDIAAIATSIKEKLPKYKRSKNLEPVHEEPLSDELIAAISKTADAQVRSMDRYTLMTCVWVNTVEYWEKQPAAAVEQYIKWWDKQVNKEESK